MIFTIGVIVEEFQVIKVDRLRIKTTNSVSCESVGFLENSDKPAESAVIDYV